MIAAAAGATTRKDGNVFAGLAGLEQLSVSADFSAPETYGFYSRVCFTQLNTVGLSVVTSTELTITRKKVHINRRPMRSLIITFVLDGVCRVVQGQHQIVADAGELLVRLSDSPYTMTLQENCTLVEASVPLQPGALLEVAKLRTVSVPDLEVSLGIVRQLLVLSTVQPEPDSAEAADAERTLLELAGRLVTEISGTLRSARQGEGSTTPSALNSGVH